jgi:virginiamycin B lyase
MRATLMLTLAAAAMVLPSIADAGPNGGDPALTGIVSSEAEGKMEGVVVTARQGKSIVEVSVTTDADGRYSFPRTHLKPGQYTLSTRAVGYDIAAPAKASVSDIEPATADIKLKKTKNLAGQLTNAEWLMSIPGTEDQKAPLLNCVGCHTLERVVRSTHNSDEWTKVISRMRGYGAVSQPIKPQPMLDRARAGNPEDFRKLAGLAAPSCRARTSRDRPARRSRRRGAAASRPRSRGDGCGSCCRAAR